MSVRRGASGAIVAAELYVPGARVWVEDAALGWAEASVASRSAATLTLQRADGTQVRKLDAGVHARTSLPTLPTPAVHPGGGLRLARQQFREQDRSPGWRTVCGFVLAVLSG